MLMPAPFKTVQANGIYFAYLKRSKFRNGPMAVANQKNDADVN
jgi:hypothetical protein